MASTKDLGTILGPGRISGSYYETRLEAPNGIDPHQNAWLTLTLYYRLLFADAHNPLDIVYTKNQVGYVRDSDSNEFRLREWDMMSIKTFTRAFEAGERFWNRCFTLITPQDYDGLDYNCIDYHVRPNVLCLFRLEPAYGGSSDAAGVHTIRCVRLDTSTSAWEDVRNFFSRPNGFRSNWKLYHSLDVQDHTVGHELGHAIGEEHIMALLGDPVCKLSAPPVCYGKNEVQKQNMMGAYMNKVELINAFPWHDRIGQHTKTDKERWVVVLGDIVPTRTIPGAVWNVAPPTRF